MSPTTNLPIVLDFDTQVHPFVNIIYYLNPNYLSLFPSGARVKLEIIDSNNNIVYTAWDYDPKGSIYNFNPHFLWNGKNKDGKITDQ